MIQGKYVPQIWVVITYRWIKPIHLEGNRQLQRVTLVNTADVEGKIFAVYYSLLVNDVIIRPKPINDNYRFYR